MGISALWFDKCDMMGAADMLCIHCTVAAKTNFYIVHKNAYTIFPVKFWHILLDMCVIIHPFNAYLWLPVIISSICVL